MWQAIQGRLAHFWHGLVVPIWTVIIAGAFGLLGAIALVRDEVPMPDPWKRELRAVTWLPHWPWFVWTLIGSWLLFAIFFEGSYRAHNKTTKGVEDPIRHREIAAQEALVAEKKRENDRIEYEQSAAGRINKFMEDRFYRTGDRSSRDD